MALSEAHAAGLTDRNPAHGVRQAKGRDKRTKRRAFTVDELRRILKIVRRRANDEQLGEQGRKYYREWTGLILFGVYSGQRLGDIAALTWRNVDLVTKELVLISEKTERTQIIPLHDALLSHLLTLPGADDPREAVFPIASRCRVGTLSNQFHRILADAGLALKRSHQSLGKGRSARRVISELSFHSFRHTNTSLLKNAGVGSAVVQDLVGHESAAMSALYTHIDAESKRKAITALPDLS
jgi:integrase